MKKLTKIGAGLLLSATMLSSAFADEITIRAGGIEGLQGAVTPCCQTLGPPNESASVLGHFQNQTFEQIYWGDD